MLVFGALMIFWALSPGPSDARAAGDPRGQGSGRIRRAPAT